MAWPTELAPDCWRPFLLQPSLPLLGQWPGPLGRKRGDLSTDPGHQGRDKKAPPERKMKFSSILDQGDESEFVISMAGKLRSPDRRFAPGT